MFVFAVLALCCIFPHHQAEAQAAYFVIDLSSSLDGQSKHSLRLGLLEEGQAEWKDTVPPPDVSGFDFYVAGDLAAPWNRLSVHLVPQAAGQRLYSWTVVVVAPPGQEVELSWNATGGPAEVRLYFTEVDVQTGNPVGDLYGMTSVTSLVVDGGAIAATTKAFEFRMYINHTPQLDPIGNRSVAENQLLSIQLSASDLDGDGLTYWASPMPPGAGLNSATGAFLWTPGFDQAGTYTATFTATDNAFPEESDSETVQIEVLNTNRPPSIDPVSISPATAYTTATLTATPSGWSDPDGDLPAYRYQWKKDGANIAGATSSTLTGGNFEKGDVIRCEVTPWDGSDTGSPKVSSPVTIRNSSPSVTSASVSPVTAYTDTTLTASAAGWTDEDDDVPGYRYQWRTNGAAIPGAVEGSLTGDFFSKSDVISCEVTPWDGEENGDSVISGSVTIRNSAPSVLSASVAPATAYTDTILSVTASGWSDPDNDPAGYRYQWKRDGVNIAGATGATLAGDNFDKGDVLSCEITPWDGSDSGVSVLSNAVTTQNSPPSVYSVSLSPGVAYTDTMLTATPSGWSDADGDSAGYRYQWKKNGGNISGATAAILTGENFGKGDEITCEVIPWDRTDTGSPKLSAPLTILNSPPSISSASISPVRAVADTTLTATAVGWADPDGDSPGYSYQWKKNGADIPGATASTLAGSNFQKGDMVRCEVTPWDGTDSGGAKLSNEVPILDDPRTLSLGAGWTLVGISRLPVEPSTSSMFGAAAVGSVWGWDGSRYTAVTSVEPLRGYWVLSTDAESVQYDCLPVTNPVPDLSSPWNVFAVAEETELPLDNPNVVGSIWGWDGTKYVRAETSLHPDQGYWAAASTGGKTAPIGHVVRTDGGGTPVLELRLDMELSGVDKGYLQVGLVEGEPGDILDPAPPAAPDGFTCYIFGSGPTPFDRLSKKTCTLAPYTERYSWTIVAQVPAGQDFSLSWEISDVPQNVILTVSELDVQDGTPRSGCLFMDQVGEVSCSATAPSAFAWEIEATCWATTSQDADGDLIADDWELQYFQGGACDPDGDEDRDGMTNLQEFLAGTNPTDVLSSLAVSVIQQDADGKASVLIWESVAGRKYQVFCCDYLPGEWRCLGTKIEGTGGALTIRDDTATAGVSQRFYRVRAW